MGSPASAAAKASKGRDSGERSEVHQPPVPVSAPGALSCRSLNADPDNPGAHPAKGTSFGCPLVEDGKARLLIRLVAPSSPGRRLFHAGHR
jgi:hypothetical protein